MSNVIKLKKKPIAFKTADEIDDQKNEPNVDPAYEREQQLKRKIKEEYVNGFNKGHNEGYEKGYTEGYEEGYAKIKEELEQKYVDQFRKKTEEFYNILAGFEEKLSAYTGAYDQIVVTMILQFAEKIIRREIQNRSNVEETIRAAIKKVMGASKVIIKINPADYSLLSEEGKINIFEDAFTKIHFEVSEAIEIGGCYIETEIGNVDAQIQTQIDELTVRFEDYLNESANPEAGDAD